MHTAQGSSPKHDPDEETIDMSQIVIPVAHDNVHTERESDIYSVHSEDIPEHNETEEDDDVLVGDGSKPVGCTSCAIM